MSKSHQNTRAGSADSLSQLCPLSSPVLPSRIGEGSGGSTVQPEFTCLALESRACCWIPAKGPTQSRRVGPSGARRGQALVLANSDPTLGRRKDGGGPLLGRGRCRGKPRLEKEGPEFLGPYGASYTL